MVKTNELIYIFARDFNQWTNEMVNQSYSTTILKSWGRGLTDQMVHYTGRIFIWYRYKEDNNALKDFMVNLSLDSPIFTEEKQNNFIHDVVKLRELIKTPKGNDMKSHYLQIKEMYFKVYTLYPLPIFICGPWRGPFLANHKQRGQKIIDLLMKSREASEGLLKEVDNYMRSWLADYAKDKGIEPGHVKLLSISEMDKLILEGIPPEKNELVKRSKGFFYMDGVIHPVADIQDFLRENNLEINKIEQTKELKGIAVSPAGILKGIVRIVLNSEEARELKEGEIMVTPMTAPDYLPAIMRSKAVITDEGSMSCHIAIVARELKKPAIMGVRIATSVLQNGDLIEIDTKTGKINRIS